MVKQFLLAPISLLHWQVSGLLEHCGLLDSFGCLLSCRAGTSSYTKLLSCRCGLRACCELGLAMLTCSEDSGSYLLCLDWKHLSEL